MGPTGESGHRRRWPGAIAALVGLAVVFCLMANEGQVRHGALLGFVALLAAVGGFLWSLDLSRAAESPVALSDTPLGRLPDEPAWAAPRVTVSVAAGLVIVLGIAFGWSQLPWVLALGLAVLVPTALSRPGLALFVIASALYLPLLGAYGLWDPWETHYGEVAREMLARDDWISLWWAQDRWFWSKPIWIFWAEGLVWNASGIDYLPDTHFRHSEWVLRLPIYLVAIAALMSVYAAVSRAFDRRAGLCAGLVLATMPYFAFLSHQAITDMPFVGQMTVAVMLLLLAVHEDPEREVRSYRVGPVLVSAQHLVLGAFLLLTVPQILYLLTRNVTMIDGMLFAWHRDEFMFGSGHNPDVPGNFGIRDQRPWAQALWIQPAAQAAVWLCGCVAASWMIARERRAQGLLMFAFYMAAGLAFMGKGIPGFALPGMVALLYLLACNRWPLMFEGRLRIGAGALTLLTLSLPWFVAMFVRHGPAFTDRILIHDHLNRLTKGVHGDTGTIQYFIWQLGYGLFPWIALTPAALGRWLLLRDDPREPDATRRRETLQVMGLWFIAAFTLFSAMKTKFHHYIFPAVPPAAVLIGLTLHEMMGPATATGAPPGLLGRLRDLRGVALAAVAPAVLVLGVAGLWGDPWGVLPPGLSMAQRAVWVLQNGWPPALCWLLIALGLAALAAAVRLHVRAEGSSEAAKRGAWLTVPLIAGTVFVAFVGRDLAWRPADRPAGDERLIHLFVYNYERPWPDHLDYRPMLTGFAVVAGVLVLGATLRVVRPVLARALVGLALVFSAWCLGPYMIELTPHWTQQNLVNRYYRERAGPEEPLVAWQMNWKGENFYTGNRVAVFVDLDNKKIEKWIDDNEGKRAFFVFEHKRLSRFKKLIGDRPLEQLTTERDNNKFTLVRVRL